MLMKKQKNILIGLVIIVALSITVFSIGDYAGFWALDPGDGGGELPVFYDNLPSAPILNDIQPDPDLDGVIELSWSASVDVWYYNIYRKFSGVEVTVALARTGISCTDSVSKEDGRYYYRIEAVNNIGRVQSNEESVTIDISEPEPILIPNPPILKLIIPNPSIDGDISLNWDSVSNVHNYTIYRSNDEVSYRYIGVVTVNSYDESMIDGTYYYKIRAGSIAGEYSGFSNVQSVIVDIPGVPESPESNEITYEIIDSKIEITVSWNDISCDTYNLYKEIISGTQSTGFVLIEEGLTLTSYTELLSEDGKYTYKITAVNTYGESELSNPTSINISGNEPTGDDDVLSNIWIYLLFSVFAIFIIILIYKRYTKR